jgi:hypothetical protein
MINFFIISIGLFAKILKIFEGRRVPFGAWQGVVACVLAGSRSEPMQSAAAPRGAGVRLALIYGKRTLNSTNM